MELVQTFRVSAPPDATYGFLLDVQRVAACVPGVTGLEAQTPDSFVGSFRVKVGPISVTYRGTATITSRDPIEHRAEISAEGTEGMGAGRVSATAVMSVAAAEPGSLVTITTDLAIAGRLAGFGRGIIDAVAQRIIGQMAGCIQRELEPGD
jgi:uncharacterized protein